MKKTVLIMAMAFGASSVFAQDLTSKKGEPILPEANDWAICFEAQPFLNYVGNMFSGSTSVNGGPTSNFLNSYNTITIKMFKDEKTAYRASVRLGFTGSTQRGMIGDAASTSTITYPALPPMVEDKAKVGGHNIGLGGGMEMRRGKTRLQGYYGAELWIWHSGDKAKYEYGNTLNPTGTPAVLVSAATTTDFGSNAALTANGESGNRNGVTDTYGGAARVLEAKAGSTLGFGLRAFIGAEYFIFSKISIGAEYGWGLGLSTTGASKYTIESTGGTGPSVGTQEIEGSKGSGWAFDTDVNGGGSGTGSGTLKLILHF